MCHLVTRKSNDFELSAWLPSPFTLYPPEPRLIWGLQCTSWHLTNPRREFSRQDQWEWRTRSCDPSENGTHDRDFMMLSRLTVSPDTWEGTGLIKPRLQQLHPIFISPSLVTPHLWHYLSFCCSLVSPDLNPPYYCGHFLTFHLKQRHDICQGDVACSSEKCVSGLTKTDKLWQRGVWQMTVSPGRNAAVCTVITDPSHCIQRPVYNGMVRV